MSHTAYPEVVLLRSPSSQHIQGDKVNPKQSKKQVTTRHQKRTRRYRNNSFWSLLSVVFLYSFFGGIILSPLLLWLLYPQFALWMMLVASALSMLFVGFFVLRGGLILPTLGSG